MRGFLVGSLILIVLETVVQPGAAARVGGMFGWGQGLLQSALSPNVAAIHQRGANTAATSSTAPSVTRNPAVGLFQA